MKLHMEFKQHSRYNLPVYTLRSVTCWFLFLRKLVAHFNVMLFSFLGYQENLKASASKSKNHHKCTIFLASTQHFLRQHSTFQWWKKNQGKNKWKCVFSLHPSCLQRKTTFPLVFSLIFFYYWKVECCCKKCCAIRFLIWCQNKGAFYITKIKL